MIVASQPINWRRRDGAILLVDGLALTGLRGLALPPVFVLFFIVDFDADFFAVAEDLDADVDFFPVLDI